jgi:hypothetical protein
MHLLSITQEEVFLLPFANEKEHSLDFNGRWQQPHLFLSIDIDNHIFITS